MDSQLVSQFVYKTADHGSLLRNSPTLAGHAKNPLGFKFSLSPRGALLSQFNSAPFLLGNEKVEISNKDLMGVAKPYFVLDGYEFVAYPNRNSVPFREFYGIPEADTDIRGSLRYEGNPAFVKALIDLGWLDTQNEGLAQGRLDLGRAFTESCRRRGFE